MLQKKFFAVLVFLIVLLTGCMGSKSEMEEGAKSKVDKGFILCR